MYSRVVRWPKRAGKLNRHDSTSRRPCFEVLECRALLTAVVVNFDSLPASGGPVAGSELSDYLAGFGVTLSHVTPGTQVGVYDSRTVSDGRLVPPSPFNIIAQAGSSGPVSYELDFSSPQDSFSVTRPFFHPGSTGYLLPEWHAYAYDSSGNLLASTGEFTKAVFFDLPAEQFVLNVPGIDHVVIASDGHNVAAIAATLDDFVLSSVPGAQTQLQNTNVLHTLLYAGQQLAVNVSVTNNLGTETKGQEAFYLSTNQTASVQGDTKLTVNGNVSLDLPPGHSTNLPQGSSAVTVLMPSTIQPGTYYVKATFSGDDDASGNSVAVSPALVTCVNSSGQVSSFKNAGTAARFDNAVNVVKQGNPPLFSINSQADIVSLIESNEGLEGVQKGKNGLEFHTYSDKGVPAIGWGADLEDSNGNVNSAFQSIIQTYLDNNPTRTNSKGQPLTFQDFLQMDSKAYVDKATATALVSAGEKDAYDYVHAHYSGLTLNQQAALTDVVYVVGTVGILQFSSMNADIAMGTPFGFACAGLELINSTLDSRSVKDFYLLTSSSGVAAKL
jgi:hypothetical protein